MQCRQHGLKLIVIVVTFVIALMTWWRTSALAANRLIMRNYGSHSEFLRQCEAVYSRLSREKRIYAYCGEKEIALKCKELSVLRPQIVSLHKDGSLNIQLSGGFIHTGFWVYISGETPSMSKGSVISPGVVWYVFAILL